MSTTREHTTQLVAMVQEGNDDAFLELEGVAKPLLVSLANKFSQCHPKFEFDDFYSIARFSLYKACFKYNDRNPSFLDFAKVCITGDFCNELKYWNATRRSIFENSEMATDITEIEDYERVDETDNPLDTYCWREFKENIEIIIDECFDDKKGLALKMHLFDDYRISEVARMMGLKYKYVYALVERGKVKIQKEYTRRYSLTAY